MRNVIARQTPKSCVIVLYISIRNVNQNQYFVSEYCYKNGGVERKKMI